MIKAGIIKDGKISKEIIKEDQIRMRITFSEKVRKKTMEMRIMVKAIIGKSKRGMIITAIIKMVTMMTMKMTIMSMAKTMMADMAIINMMMMMIMIKKGMMKMASSVKMYLGKVFLVLKIMTKEIDEIMIWRTVQ